jgi:predicted dehydrogenase/NADPH:quinone reductase-like Zn-dependent oxidoreductase
MKQILQNLKSGEMEIAEVPCAQPGRGQVLIQTRASLISAGTERMLVEFSKANLIQKARQQPDKVKQVLDKIKTDGLIPTLEAVFRKLDEPLPLGYCNAGVVLEVGPGITDLQPGDRVVSNGNHAEVVCVPRNLVAKIPENVSDEHAAFTVLAAIALQGVRLVRPTFGEKISVFGMGLIGLLTVQFLRASGCEVLAIDLNPQRLALAEKFGAKTADISNGGDPVAATRGFTSGQGIDASIITASAKTDEIMHQAAESCRKRGRIVLVGVVGLNLRRSDFYQKELTFQVSCSYGPGRYDESYEHGGHDYPAGFVRWTEGRNFEAVLSAISNGSLDLSPLVSHRFKLDDALKAYGVIENDPGALGVVLQYSGNVNRSSAVTVRQKTSATAGKAIVGVIGAGNFSKGVLLPALAKSGARLAYIADLNGAAAKQAAVKFEAQKAVSDYRQILDDKQVDAVFVITGHNTHARFICEALEAGKHVFVEKPLCLHETELDTIESAVCSHSSAILMVGFNRRFSPHTVKAVNLLAGRSVPLCMNMTVNAGEIPADHWVQDPERGGGRIVGEGCHFIDLLSFIADSPVKSVSAAMVGDGAAIRDDKMSIVLEFVDGSIGTVNYFANGAKSYPKEMLEIFSDGSVVRMENFRVTHGFGFKGFKRFKTSRQDKGHFAEVEAFIRRIEKGGEPLIPFSQLKNVTQASFAAVKSARERKRLQV